MHMTFDTIQRHFRKWICLGLRVDFCLKSSSLSIEQFGKFSINFSQDILRILLRFLDHIA